MILNDEEIRRLIVERSLITNYMDIEKQITPNGFDLTVEKVFEFVDEGAIGFSNEERVLPEMNELNWKTNFIKLNKGCYKVRTNEIIKMPLNLVGIAMPRSSLLRSGVTISTGVWDAGFEGKSEFLLMVENDKGFKIWRNARVVQIIFIISKKVEEGYSGVYKLLS
jgi:dUTP pyrophosphatase